MRHLTIRNVSDELADRLEAEKQVRGRSLNQTVLDLLSQALGLDGGGRHSNGLKALAGTLSAAEVEELESALQLTREIDEELWR